MKKLFAIIFVLSIMLSACSAPPTSNDSTQPDIIEESTTTPNYVPTTTTNPEPTTEENNDTINSRLFNVMMDNRDEWEYTCDSYTQAYTYDPVKASTVYFYLSPDYTEYYIGVLYVPPVPPYTVSHHRVFLLTEDSLEFLYAGKYTDEDETVKTCKFLAAESYMGIDDFEETTKKLIDNALVAEKKFIDNISLNNPNPITLSENESILFNNIYAAIGNLEYHYSGDDKRMSLTKIEYYIFDNLACDVLLTYESVPYVYVTGYRIDGTVCTELSEREISILENSKKDSTSWDVEWTSEKKEYKLKQAISKYEP